MKTVGTGWNSGSKTTKTARPTAKIKEEENSDVVGVVGLISAGVLIGGPILLMVIGAISSAVDYSKEKNVRSSKL